MTQLTNVTYFAFGIAASNPPLNADTPYIVFLQGQINNDVVLTSGWSQPIITQIIDGVSKCNTPSQNPFERY